MKKIVIIAISILLILSSCSGNINTETSDDSQPPIETPSDENTTTPSTPSTDVPSTPPETPSEDNPSIPSEPEEPVNPPDEEPDTPPEEENPKDPVTPPEDTSEELQITKELARQIAGYDRSSGLKRYTLQKNHVYDNESAYTGGYKGSTYAYCFTGTTDENGSGSIECKLYFDYYSEGQDNIRPTVELEGTVLFLGSHAYDISETKMKYYISLGDFGKINEIELNSKDKELINSYLQGLN